MLGGDRRCQPARNPAPKAGPAGARLTDHFMTYPDGTSSDGVVVACATMQRDDPAGPPASRGTLRCDDGVGGIASATQNYQVVRVTWRRHTGDRRCPSAVAVAAGSATARRPEQHQSSRAAAHGRVVVLQVRFNLITRDRFQWGDVITFAEDRPAVESLHGSLGTFLAANRARGAAMLQPFWASRAALMHSGDLVAPARDAVARRAAGTVSVERCRVPVFRRGGAAEPRRRTPAFPDGDRAVRDGRSRRGVRGHRRASARDRRALLCAAARRPELQFRAEGLRTPLPGLPACRLPAQSFKAGTADVAGHERTWRGKLHRVWGMYLRTSRLYR